MRAILRSRHLRRLAKQTVGLKRVPVPLQEAIKGYLADYPKHQLRQHVFNLSLMITGRKEPPQKEIAPTYELSPKILAAVDDYFAHKGACTPVPKRYRSKGLRPKYDEKQVAAYVAARMPSVYSVIHNVLSEVARRLPDFHPENALDYGSGPGTCIWALSQVWPNAVKLVNMVETSPAMLAASKKFLGDMEDPPTVQNHKTLRVLSTKTRHSGHDIVIACYSIGELSSVEDQITAARQLWSLTRDILVIIEPGTSEGSLTVRGIRAHILALERKKLRRRRKYIMGSTDNDASKSDAPMIGPGSSGNVEEKRDRLVAHAEDEEIDLPDGGAHVVAPCPHDGVCPMDGTKLFCHFIQRVERTYTQRMAKKHKRAMLRGYEDEKYSYVVLRRGRRPRLDWPLDHVDLQLDEEEPIVNHLLADYKDEDVEEGELDEEEEDEEELDEDVEEEDGENKLEKEDAEEEEEEEEDEEVDNNVNEGDEISDNEEEESAENTGKNDGDEYENYDDANAEGGSEEEENPESTETVANMSGGWGRVIFKPYRRGRHVVLDVCRSTETDGSSGSLDRLTVTRAKHRVLHREAKKVRWGDLWAATSSEEDFRGKHPPAFLSFVARQNPFVQLRSACHVKLVPASLNESARLKTRSPT